MSTSDFQEHNRPFSRNESENALTDDSEYFDRERWRDVESDGTTEEPGFREKSVQSTMFSIAVFLLVGLTAAVLGVLFARQTGSLIPNGARSADRRDYRIIPADRIGYEAEKIFYCDVNRPLCFAVSKSGMSYIGDELPPKLHVFDAEGSFVRDFPLDEAPRCLAVGEADTIFSGRILVGYSDHLGVYSDSGEKISSFDWSPNPDIRPSVWSLALTDQALFAVDSASKIFYRIDEFGETTRFETVGAQNSPNGGENVFPGFAVYLSPISLTVSPKNGLLYIANPGKHRVEAFTQDGIWEPSLSWGNASAELSGFVGCCNPVGLVALEDGRIMTAEKSLLRIKVFQRDGTLDQVVAGPDTLESKPDGISALDAIPARTITQNNEQPVFFGVTGTGTVIVFDPVYKVLRRFVPLSQQDR